MPKQTEEELRQKMAEILREQLRRPALLPRGNELRSAPDELGAAISFDQMDEIPATDEEGELIDLYA